jgi:Icc-related predicted phosphoesterase
LSDPTRSDVVTPAVPGGDDADEHRTLRIVAIGDVHCGKESHGRLRDLFAKATKQADVLLLCGDLTNYGTREEAEVLAR